MLHGALDLSNYTTNVPVPGAGAAGGFITDQHVKVWLDSGYNLAIVGSQWPLVAKHQVEVCKRGGMATDLYHWLDHDRDMVKYLGDRKFLAETFDIGRHWLDCEDATNGKPIATITEDIEKSLGIVDGWHDLQSGIYTGEWWWVPNTGNSQNFSHRPLWHAGYVPGLTLEGALARFGEFRSYGGWHRPVVWQFQGSVQQMGANLDLNVYEVVEDLPLPTVPAPPIQTWGSRQEGYFETFYYGNLPVYRLGSTDGLHQGRISRNRGGVWYWDRTDPSNGNLYQSIEEGD